MKKLMEALIVPVSGGAGFQRLLELNVSLSQYLMGIGSGSSVRSSGEKVLVDKLSKQYAATKTPLCIFDVGANKGQFLELMENGLHSIYSGIHIHAFEPDRHAYKSLCDYAASYSNVTLNNIGLGKRVGEFELLYDQAGSGLASLSKRRLEHFGIDFKYADKVTLDTLDNYCMNHAIPSIDLLKLDVEGHELDVLQGGLQMFRSRRVRMV